MSNHQKKQPCSKLKSVYHSCRRHLSCSNPASSIRLAINPTPVPKRLGLPPNNRNVTNEGNLRRVCDLEAELAELEEWFCSELKRLKSHLGTTIDTANANDNSEGANKFERLDNCEGGYLYTYTNAIKNINGNCQGLSIQISCPALVPTQIGFTTISEGLDQMEKMGKEKLMNWLLESFPMPNISTNKTIINSSTNPNNVLEAILINSIDRLQELVIQGLQIQMGAKEMAKQGKINEARKNKIDDEGGNVIIMVVIIQARDPYKEYEEVNEMMIGLIEATTTNSEFGYDDIGFSIKGVHVVGLVGKSRNGHVIDDVLWCVSS